MFVLPGVKLQIPNGRNKDGTCRSIIATVDSVKIITRADSLTTSIHWYLTSNLSPYSSNIWSFDADKNIYVSSSGVMASVEIAHGYLTSGKITSFEPYTVDSVVNSNASNFSQAGRSYLSGLGMPSSRYIDLTLGASGSTYTAPANGWLFLMKRTADQSQNIRFICNGREDIAWGSGIKNTDVISLFPVCSGDVVTIKYSAEGRVSFFRFIYANGEQ